MNTATNPTKELKILSNLFKQVKEKQQESLNKLINLLKKKNNDK